MSAIERVLERRLDYVAPFVYDKTSGEKYWTEATIEALDAALEYWLMRHSNRRHREYNLLNPAVRYWDDKEGWTCDCLDK